ncbi:MAG: hypothetical protein FIA92_13745 [Chloroflexi bacterium]|nr:hypothetical protein [Chloroflexota bacterium]
MLRRRADLARLDAEAEAARTAAAAAVAAQDAVAKTVEAGEARLAAARAAETAAGATRRRLEEEERAAAGAAASAAREAAWLAAQAERLEADAARLQAVAAERAAAISAEPVEDPGRAPDGGASGAPLAALEERVRELRVRREGLAAAAADAAATRAEGERRRARAEASSAMAERRRDELDRAAALLAEREAGLAAEGESLTAALAAATRAVSEADAALAVVLGEDAGDRERLRTTEAAAAAAREGLRVAEDRARGIEREGLEARLALEGLRESLLVELAGLGALGLRHLAPGASIAAPDEGLDDVEPEALEAALAAAATAWERDAPPAEAPSPGRIAALRRRFHELGAGNPFAVEEYAELKPRLETLESQRADLLAAIEGTRSLIRELERLIGDQFRTTFAALERAFDERFRQLFGGGFAKLSLTDPEDLSATGVEITARPPGKKPQALAMLSGGERALTAVALLFAMLEVRPVPFCVLDEVDAALDEANIGRFTDALRELSARTQCIVITHNRGTIETADALYGVTVGDDSVSHVISLRLDEATELASRNGERAGTPLVVGG